MLSALKGAFGVTEDVSHNFASFHDISAVPIEGGEPIQMSRYRGKVCIVANVACK